MMDKLDSSDFAEGKFSQHGRLIAWPDDHILRYEVTGPMNLETISALGRMRKDLYAQFDPPTRSFAILAVFHVSMLMPPEAIELFQRDLRDAYATNARLPVAVAWMADDDVEGSALMFRFVKKVHDEIETPCELFKDVATAELWLRGFLKGV